MNPSNNTDEWVSQNGKSMMSSSRGEFSNATVKRHQDLRNMSREDINMMDRFQRNPRMFRQGDPFPTSSHSGEGPSNYDSDSSYGYREPLRNSKGHNGANRALSGLDHAELLMQINELKARLQSFGVVDQPKEEIPFRHRMAPLESHVAADSWFSDGIGPSRSDSPTAGSALYGNSPETSHYPARNVITGHGLYPVHHPNNVPGYADPYSPHAPRGTGKQFGSAYQTLKPDPNISRQHTGRNQVPYMPYSTSTSMHNSSCSCYHCHEKHQQALASVASTAFSNNRFSASRNSRVKYHFENLEPSGQHFHNSRSEKSPSRNLHSTKLHARWPGDVNSEMSDFEQFHRYSHSPLVISRVHHLCYPIVGGAPFLTCHDCFVLLKLPRKLKLQGKAQHKLRCGTCSTIMKFAIINKKFVFLDNVEARSVRTKIHDSTEIDQENFHHHVDQVAAHLAFNDYDNSGSDLQSMDTEPAPQPKDQYLNSIEPRELRRFLSSSSSTSENDNSLDDLTASGEALNSLEPQIKTILSSSPPASQLENHSGYSSNDPLLNQFGKGNKSHQLDQENSVSNKVATRQDSMKEASIITEINVAYDEFQDTVASHDSTDANRENDQCKKAGGGDSFLSNIIKKSFKDFSRSDHIEEDGKSCISVNGQAISELDVKKAEKLAGPIKPGEYWYDFRAGFWGVMYGPCLGIIPSFIEEFNFPMPENCSSGDTGVLVNGRELHQKDLDLLASRGLPGSRGRSYIIDISGRVLDEDSSNELDGLGKLAPTIEKLKHGFGMMPPRAAN